MRTPDHCDHMCLLNMPFGNHAHYITLHFQYLADNLIIQNNCIHLIHVTVEG